jgi:hypothetical protein
MVRLSQACYGQGSQVKVVRSHTWQDSKYVAPRKASYEPSVAQLHEEFTCGCDSASDT